MPQLDIDLFDDFIFFAFVFLLFGTEDEGEEGVIAMGTDLFLVEYYIKTKKLLTEKRKIVKELFVLSIFQNN